MIGKDGKTYLFRRVCMDCGFIGDWYTTSTLAKENTVHSYKRDRQVIRDKQSHLLMLERICQNPQTGYGMNIVPKG